jgi:hypothetical protein
MDKKMVWVPALILSLGMIIGCYFISAKPFTTTVVAQSKNNGQDTILLNMNETAKLLGLSVKDISKIITYENNTLNNTSSFEGERLPYIKINDEFYFEKTSLLKWAMSISLQHREYKAGSISNY